MMGRESDYEYPVNPDDGNAWLISYADLITLLVTFFILMLSMSEVQLNKFDLLRSEFSKSEVNDLTAVQKRLERYIEEAKLGATVSTNLDMEGLKLQFTNTVLFDSGSAEVTPAGRTILDSTIVPLAGLDENYRFVVEGYTDDVPIHTAQFDSNWSLSAGRAIRVLQVLKASGVDERRLSVQGFADTRPAETEAAALTGAELETWRARNRRVVIRVY